MIDRWTIGHFILGLFLGMTMKTLLFALIFLVGWEVYEILFRPDVKESLANRVVDVLVGTLGAFLGSIPIVYSLEVSLKVFQGVLASGSFPILISFL
jgi:hypothetical protein